MVCLKRERPRDDEAVVIQRERKSSARTVPKPKPKPKPLAANALSHDSEMRPALFALGRALLDVRGMAIELRRHIRLPRDAAGQFERDLTDSLLKIDEFFRTIGDEKPSAIPQGLKNRMKKQRP
jgi:hypothetical protein